MKLMIRGALAVFVIGAAACGDPRTTDDRGYTKAPLENPTVVIRGEEPGTVSRYGAPRRVEAEPIVLPEAAQPAPATGTGPVAQVELPAGVTQEMVGQGQELYGGAGNCFTCHAPNAAGTPLAPALNDGSWIHIDGSYDAIVRIISEGVPVPSQYPAAMPARGGAPLSDEQVRQIAAYVYSISR